MDSTYEVIQAQQDLWNHLYCFINPMVIKCAVELGIFDAIDNHGGHMTLPELLPAISVPSSKSSHLRHLMLKLTSSGYFCRKPVSSEDDDDGDIYLLTPLSRLLVKDKKINLAPYVLSLIHPVALTSGLNMSEWFKKTEEPRKLTPFMVTHGCDFWSMADRNADFGGKFNEAMACDGRLVMDVLLKEHKNIFEGITSLVDVGGGVGAAAKAIADAFPGIKCISLDLPHGIGNKEGMDGNIELVAGDMFQHIPRAHVVFLKWILHNWDDEECVKILQRCREAIPSREEGGKVIIVEIVMGYSKSDPKAKEVEHLWDTMMMVSFASSERNERGWKKIFMDAGFSDYKIMPFLGIRSVIELYP